MFLIVDHIYLVYFINCSWDTDLNKLDDFLLDPFCIYNKYAMFWFVFSVKNYTNKIMFKLKLIFTGYILFFLFLLKKHRLWELVRTPSLKQF